LPKTLALALSDTIVAQATPPGTGAVALLRLSGPRALAIAVALARQDAGLWKDRTPRLCTLFRPGSAGALARHDVKVEIHRIGSDEVPVADLLLNRISDESIDLLVMGAYGHARVREIWLGGVTRDVLRHMTAPVLIPHEPPAPSGRVPPDGAFRFTAPPDTPHSARGAGRSRSRPEPVPELADRDLA